MTHNDDMLELFGATELTKLLSACQRHVIVRFYTTLAWRVSGIDAPYRWIP